MSPLFHRLLLRLYPRESFAVLSDLRLATRTLRKVPGFTTAAVLTLALGIGVHTVVSAVVDAMILRPLPFGDRSDRLVTVHSSSRTPGPQDLRTPGPQDLRTPGPQDLRTPGPQDPRTPGPQDLRTSGIISPGPADV